MREQDKFAFRQTAQQMGVHILVRDTNVDSLRYIGQSGYFPKPIDCKAKTADGKARPQGRDPRGLVVSPNLLPEAFSGVRLEKAKKSWADFEPVLRDSRGTRKYSVVDDKSSALHGFLMLDGKLLHGDYDLKDVIKPGIHARRNLGLVKETHGQINVVGYLQGQVQDHVNTIIGVPVVQHGGAAQYSDHDDEPIHRFDPDGQHRVMSAISVELWYLELKRATHGAKQNYTYFSGSR